MRRARDRLLIAGAIGLGSSLLAVLRYVRLPAHPADFAQCWFATRAMFRGANPYALVGPGLEFNWPWRLFYPGTTFVITAPLAIFPAVVATALFVGISGALLAYAVTKEGWHRLWIFLSAPYLVAAASGQWSPALAAAVLLTPLGFLVVAKPNLGIALTIGTDSPKFVISAAVGVAVAGTVSVLLLPHWPADWWRTIQESHLWAPVTRFGGPLILLALLRWKRPEARMIVALACVPQTAYWYECVPLLLVPKTYRETQIYTLVVSCGIVIERFLVTSAPFEQTLGEMTVILAYLPAVFLVLRRPNEGQNPLTNIVWPRRRALQQRESA